MNTFHVQPPNQELNARKVTEMNPSWFEHLIFNNPFIYTICHFSLAQVLEGITIEWFL
jgi:hypothetical protein